MAFQIANAAPYLGPRRYKETIDITVSSYDAPRKAYNGHTPKTYPTIGTLPAPGLPFPAPGTPCVAQRLPYPAPGLPYLVPRYGASPPPSEPIIIVMII